MTITLRPYQQLLVDQVRDQWRVGNRNVLMRSDTGSGKTAMLGKIVQDHPGASCVTAHRSELVSQLSLTLAKYGVRHSLIASDATKRGIARAHVEEYGQCYYTPGARCAVASVDTLVRAKGLDAWMAQVTLIVQDEGHHSLRANKWGKAIDRFTHPERRMLLPTATPGRSDGQGLGSHADGYADVMIEGPPMRWLIEHGYLTDYEILCPPSDLQVLADPAASGDWSPTALREAAKHSHIVGDVVAHYSQWAYGRLGITFCTDVETAVETTAAFRAAGVPAETLTGETPDPVRRDILRRYRAREILQLVTVDIVSEGFDLPAIEVASMARPTQSLALYMQQFGRALRPMAGKSKALIIDHASNTLRHGGPPDKPRVWSLDRRDRRSAGPSDAIPLRVCIECFKPYEAIYRTCPHCGYAPTPASRSSPAAVDGDLALLDAETLERLRGAVIDTSGAGWGAEQWRLTQTGLTGTPLAGALSHYKRTQDAQGRLRESMRVWAGAQAAEGLDDATMQRLFYLRYGTDVLSAMALRAAEASALADRIDSVVIAG